MTKNDRTMERIPGPLYFITMDDGPVDHLRQVDAACKAGVKWIQLRMKEADDVSFRATAAAAMAICESYGCSLILNDRVAIVRALRMGHRSVLSAAGKRPHGVHLGLQDMPVAAARELLGKDCIIGGTANTLEDIRRHAHQGADYIGLGPYRYTSTKKNLSPVLGLEGYQRIMKGLHQEGIGLPVIAIGGILREDIPGLLEAGVYGVAFSGMLLQAADPIGLIEDLQQTVAGRRPGGMTN